MKSGMDAGRSAGWFRMGGFLSGAAAGLAMLAACAGMSLSHCSEPAPPAGAAAGAAGPLGQVALPSGRILQVELADTPGKLERGYMFREKVSDREGMLFFMPQLDFHAFWMKNCKVGLDILWLDEKWQIVHIARSVPPCKADPCPSYQPLQAALYVLEVQDGLTARDGIKLGEHIIYTPPAAPAR